MRRNGSAAPIIVDPQRSIPNKQVHYLAPFFITPYANLKRAANMCGSKLADAGLFIIRDVFYQGERRLPFSKFNFIHFAFEFHCNGRTMAPDYTNTNAQTINRDGAFFRPRILFVSASPFHSSRLLPSPGRYQSRE